MHREFLSRRAPLALVAACSLSSVAHAQAAQDEVVVTGVPHARSPGELAQSVSVIRDDTLNRLRGGSLGETLANQIGVSSSYFGAGASRPIVRGLAGARVRTLEDGIDSMDAAIVSDDHAVSVEPLVADQIEIFRGPTTLLYGSGAVGGVINTVTTRIPERAPDGGFGGGFEVRGDSVAESRAAAVRLDGGGGLLAWHFDGLHRTSGDYEIPGFARSVPQPGDVAGTVQNSAVEVDAASLGGSWLGDGGFIGIAFNSFDSLYGIPGAGDEPVRIDLAQRRTDLKGGWSDVGGAIEEIELRLAINDYEHVELEGAEEGTLFTNDAAEGRVELVHAPFGRFSGAFGLQFGHSEFAAIGEEAFVPPVETTSYGVFLLERLDLTAWQLSFGGRIETQKHEPSRGLPAVADDAASVSVAGVRALGKGYSFVVNATSAQRLPVPEELYSDGPHLATAAIQVGDPQLRRETSRHLDIGIRREQGDLAWSVTAFRTRFEDFIYLADTGVVDMVERLPVFAYVQDDADFVGVEAELFTPIAELGGGEVDMRVFADFVDGALRDGDDLPRMPPHRVGARFQYHDERLHVGIEGTRYADQNRIASFETPTPGYVLVNADFRWRFNAPGSKPLDLFVNATNLTDVEARKHTSFVKDLAPLPGRNYVIGVRSRF